MNQESTGPNEPDWSQLPHAPRNFFGLAADADLRDLKRAYGKLIRRYKPEKNPEEFQRIRAAYEQLSSQFRYGAADAEPTRFDWNPSQGNPEPSTSPKSPAPDKEPETSPEPSGQWEPMELLPLTPLEDESAASPLMNRLEDASLDELIRQLQDRTHKTPRDYFQLSMLATVVEQQAAEAGKDGTFSFASCLWDGLRQYPSEPGLLALLSSHLNHFVSLDELPGWLLQAAETIDRQQYFRVTEEAWDRLLRDAEFETFAGSLEKCETVLRLHRDDSLLVFYVHIMKAAIWRGDDRWVESRMAILEDHYHQLPGWAQDEFEIFGWLRQVVEVRAAWRAQGPLACQVDDAIAAWSLNSGEAATNVVVFRCHTEIASRGTRLLDEFPPQQEEFHAPYLMIWSLIAAEYHGPQDNQVFEQQETYHHAHQFLSRVTRRSNRGARYTYGYSLMMLAFTFAIYCAGVSLALVVRFFWRLPERTWLESALEMPAAVAVLVVGCMGGWWLLQRGRDLSRLRYELIREEILKLLRVVPVSPRNLGAIIAEMKDVKVDDHTEVSGAEELVASMLDDPAVELYSTAQRCLVSRRQS